MKDDIVVDRSPIVEQYLPPAPAKPSSASSSPGSQGADPDSTLNRKQTLIKSNIELRKRFESMVLKWQEILCDPVTEDVLGEAVSALLLLPSRVMSVFPWLCLTVVGPR